MISTSGQGAADWTGLDYMYNTEPWGIILTDMFGSPWRWPVFTYSTPIYSVVPGARPPVFNHDKSGQYTRVFRAIYSMNICLAACTEVSVNIRLGHLVVHALMLIVNTVSSQQYLLHCTFPLITVHHFNPLCISQKLGRESYWQTGLQKDGNGGEVFPATFG